MHAFLAVCEEAARAGGEVLQHWRGRFAVRSKAPADLVTEADFQSQRRIREIVLKAFPDHDFLGEEADGIPTETAKYRWIVDPLDGTTNYVHGLPHYSVSIGLMQDDEPIVGVVFDPAKDECFAAAKGFGATLNGESIRASQVVGLEEALVVTGFAPGVTGDSEEAAMFLHMLGHCQAIRRLDPPR